MMKRRLCQNAQTLGICGGRPVTPARSVIWTRNVPTSRRISRAPTAARSSGRRMDSLNILRPPKGVRVGQAELIENARDDRVGQLIESGRPAIEARRGGQDNRAGLDQRHHVAGVDKVPW